MIISSVSIGKRVVLQLDVQHSPLQPFLSPSFPPIDPFDDIRTEESNGGDIFLFFSNVFPIIGQIQKSAKKCFWSSSISGKEDGTRE